MVYNFINVPSAPVVDLCVFKLFVKLVWLLYGADCIP